MVEGVTVKLDGAFSRDTATLVFHTREPRRPVWFQPVIGEALLQREW